MVHLKEIRFLLAVSLHFGMIKAPSLSIPLPTAAELVQLGNELKYIADTMNKATTTNHQQRILRGYLHYIAKKSNGWMTEFVSTPKGQHKKDVQAMLDKLDSMCQLYFCYDEHPDPVFRAGLDSGQVTGLEKLMKADADRRYPHMQPALSPPALDEITKKSNELDTMLAWPFPENRGIPRDIAETAFNAIEIATPKIQNHIAGSDVVDLLWKALRAANGVCVRHYWRDASENDRANHRICQRIKDMFLSHWRLTPTLQWARNFVFISHAYHAFEKYPNRAWGAMFNNRQGKLFDW